MQKKIINMVDIVLQKEYDRVVELHDSTPASKEPVKDSDNIIAINSLSTQQMEDDLLTAHFDGNEYTEDEPNEIRQFAEFVKNKRK